MADTTIDPLLTSHKNWIEETNKNLDLILDEEMFIHCLQEQWEGNEDIIKMEDRRNPRKVANTAVEVFEYYLEVGFIPPPEILLTIAGLFRTYFSYGGTVSLEDVFFGEPKRGVGNYAARKKDKLNIYSRFNFFLSCPVNRNTGRSMVEQAELFFNEEIEWHEKVDLPYEQPDMDTFQRQYRRWVNRQVSKKEEDN